MANIFQPKKRHAVPSFRGFSETALTAELASTRAAAIEAYDFDITERVEAWEAAKTIGTAGDLLSSAIVARQVDLQSVRDAATFVLDQTANSPALLRASADTVLGPLETAEVTRPRLRSFIETHNREALYLRISKNRQALRRFPRNAILYVENARLYSILGQEIQAIECMRMAVVLAPTNRYVLRCAARLYAHFEDAERGLYLLRQNPATRADPWLASAELALAGLTGQESRLVRRGIALAESDQLSPASRSELNSGLATVMLLAGDRRQSKTLFRSALVHPTDNALAQLEWAFSLDRLFDVQVSAYDVSHNDEALAREAFASQDWAGVLQHCEAWFLDIPFARAPVFMASHIASIVVDDFETAALFCRAGLVSHPHDPALLNNLAYALALDNRVHDAQAAVDLVPQYSVLDDSGRISLEATRGLIAFRRGEIEVGRGLYRQAIDAAQKVSNQSLPQLAFLNYAREELRATNSLPAEIAQELRRMRIDPRQLTLQLFHRKVMDQVARVRSGPSNDAAQEAR